ncbi:MAG TPA: carboxypeptidase-like regulatory domain-containing protein [Bryobacteraceae bacterium]|nr:carboxypeptidase-like regulatory domain-containing protein [Bryobacteraceae bacterium]
MRTLLLLTVAAAVGRAATIRGVVLENQSGHPLMRTTVAIAPVAGGAGSAMSARTNRYGTFEFPPLRAGSYLVSVARPGFAPTEYGQKEWRSAGVPIVLNDTDDTFLNIRMKRFGAISGAVLDENEVGLPEVTVVAYRNTRPPELVAKAVTDDRGIYRIFGLEPGSYLVRSTAKDYSTVLSGGRIRFLEEGGYLPTFSRQTGRVDEAMPVEVRLDEQADYANIKAEPGRLLAIGGTIYAGNPSADAPPATVTLVSDMERESVTTTNEFRFNPVAPGEYELFAETLPDRRGNRMAGYLALSMDRDRPDIRFPLTSVLFTYLRVQDGSAKPMTDIKIQARRRDLAGTDATRTLDPGRPLLLPPGPWEFSIAPMAAYYVSDFSGPGHERSPQHPPDGWNEVILGSALGNSVAFTLTAGPGSVQGTVNGPSGAAAGAPVFLESYDPRERRRLKDVTTVRADIRGRYQFIGLPPGTYRVLSSFEYQSPDEATMEHAHPRVVTIEGGRAQVQDLDLYVIQ